MVCRKLGFLGVLTAALLISYTTVADSAEGYTSLLPQQGDTVHLGVASCASSVCHGKAEKSQTRRVWLTEFRIWQVRDSHATAFDTLLTPASEDIARKLGIADASRAEVCLDCHSDNVAPALRGPKFQLSDGVGCEACHGGSEQWISSHTDDGVSYADNLDHGMYPTAAPDSRAQLCLSCHLGNADKFASHDIMGAGHPQLLFELSSFSINQPMHYAIDADYVQRKGDFTPIDFWLQGMAVAASSTLDLFDQQQTTSNSIFPELTFYQCDGCHQKTDRSFERVDAVWNAVPAGAVRLNDTPMRLFITAAIVLELEGANQALDQLDRLVLAASVKREDIVTHKTALVHSLTALQTQLSERSLLVKDLKRLREGFLALAASNKANYFSYAFNIFLAVNHLNAAIGDGALSEDDIRAWFTIVQTESAYNPRQFAAMAIEFLRRET